VNTFRTLCGDRSLSPRLSLFPQTALESVHELGSGRSEIKREDPGDFLARLGKKRVGNRRTGKRVLQQQEQNRIEGRTTRREIPVGIRVLETIRGLPESWLRGSSRGD